MLTYGGNAPQVWWKQNQQKLSAIKNLPVFTITDDQSKALALLAERSMQLQATLDGEHIWLTSAISLWSFR
ncbi:MAG: YaeQ family protein [Porticoccaceae bacterium]